MRVDNFSEKMVGYKKGVIKTKYIEKQNETDFFQIGKCSFNQNQN